MKGSSPRPTKGPPVPPWPVRFWEGIAMSPLPQPLRASLCVASGFFAFQLLHTFFIGTGAAHGAAARHGRLDNTPSAAPTADRRAGALQPKGHDLPQRDHGRGLVLPDTRGAQSRGGRTRHACGAGILSSSAPRLSPRAQATPRRITPTSSSTVTTRTAWCTASDEACGRPSRLLRLGLTCVCDPQRPREGSSEESGGLCRGPHC